MAVTLGPFGGMGRAKMDLSNKKHFFGKLKKSALENSLVSQESNLQ